MSKKDNFTKIKSNKYIIMILLMIVSAAGFYFFYEGKVKNIAENKSYMQFISDNEDSNLGQIKEDINLQQTFKVKEDFKGVAIRFSTYAKENQGDIKAKLFDLDNNEIIQEWDVDVADLADNSYYEFELDNPIYNANEKEYKIELNISGLDEENFITLTSSIINQYEDGELYINGEKQDVDLCVATISLNSNFLKYMYLIIAVILTIFVGSIYYLIFIRKSKIENIFLVSAICIGLTYVFLQTPYSAYDEPAHINTAYRYSNKLLGINNSIFNGDLPKRAVDNYSGLSYASTSISNYKTVFDNLFEVADESQRQIVPMNVTRVKEAPYIYLPSVIGMTIARVLHLGQIPLYILGRIFNLSFFIAACYFAIRKIPFAKILLFVSALIPMNLSQSSTFSYDSVINGLSYILIAYCLSIAFGKEEVKRKDLIVFFIITLLLAPLKKIYVLLCFIALIIPKSRFKDIKKYRIYLVSLICSVIVFYLVINIVEAISILTVQETTAVFENTQAYTVSDIISNPISFIGIFISSIWNQIHQSMYYSIVAFYGAPTNQILTFVYIIILFLASIKTRDEEVYIKNKDRLILGVVIALIIAALFVVGFTWTEKGGTVIRGVQGRYILPFLPLMLLLTRNSNLVVNKNMDKGLMFSTALCEVIISVNLFSSILSNS